jgi:H+-transporting ATPase
MSKVPFSTEQAKKTTIDELLDGLSATRNGLSSTEANERFQQYGPNEIPERKENPLLKFLSYF